MTPTVSVELTNVTPSEGIPLPLPVTFVPSYRYDASGDTPRLVEITNRDTVLSAFGFFAPGQIRVAV